MALRELGARHGPPAPKPEETGDRDITGRCVFRSGFVLWVECSLSTLNRPGRLAAKNPPLAPAYSQYATHRASMLSRMFASGKLLSRKAVWGQRQVRVWSLSLNLKISASSAVMLEKYHQR